MTSSGYHDTRARPNADREVLWATLCASYFQGLIEPEFHVLDLGAGYANFINNIRCRTPSLDSRNAHREMCERQDGVR